MNHLIVFDIDGTLIDVQGAGHRAMDHAFEASYGIAHAFDGISFAGATDLGVLHTAAQKHHLRMTPEDVLAFKTLFTSHIQRELQQSPGHALPGLPDRLFELQADGFDLALGTGNFKTSAYLKLALFGMAGFFPVGSFGDDGMTRLDILTHGIERARTYYQKNWDQITVLGDTPGDMAAAEKLGTVGLGVTTGAYSEAELKSAGAHAVLPNLADRDALINHLRP